MRSKSLVLIALALGCGLVAAIGANQLMNDRSKSADQGERQPVFVAMTDINANEELTAQNIKMEEWPKGIIPQGALTKLEEVEGKRCRMKLYAGEPILSSKLLSAAESVGAAKDIPPGYRVAQVKVDPVSGTNNLILPGDRVDVILFHQPQSNRNATASKIVLQDIKVFSVDTHTETEFSQTKGEQTEPMTAKSIALLVTPQQAEILHAAAEMGGALRLVLRNPDDNAHVASQGASIGDVFGQDQRSSREAEEASEKEKNNLTAWLNEDKSKPAVAAEAPPAPGPPAPWKKMIVMLGSQIMQVDFPGNGQMPIMRQSKDQGAGFNDMNVPGVPPSMHGGPTSPLPGGVPLPPAEEEPSSDSEETGPNN